MNLTFHQNEKYFLMVTFPSDLSYMDSKFGLVREVSSFLTRKQKKNKKKKKQKKKKPRLNLGNI